MYAKTQRQETALGCVAAGGREKVDLSVIPVLKLDKSL